MKKLIVIFLIAILAPFIYGDDIIVEQVVSTPTQVSPSDNLELAITLSNVGEDKIETIIAKLDLSQVPFAPYSSSSERIIKDLREDEDSDIYFNLVALPTATPGIYKVPLIISYNNISQTSLISLVVQAKPKITLELEGSDPLYPGSKSHITIKLINRGFSKVSFVNVVLEDAQEYSVLSSKSVYLGNIDIDDTETAEFELFINEAKTLNIPVKLEFYDANNNLYRETKYLTAKVYTEEEAKSLGLIKQQGSFIWIIALIGIVIIYLFIRSRKKKEAK